MSFLCVDSLTKKAGKTGKKSQKEKPKSRERKLRVSGMRKPRGIGAEVNFQSFFGGVKNPQTIRALRKVP